MIFKEYHDRMLIERPKAIAAVTSAFRIHPAVVLTGPRQCGKTTWARMFTGNDPTVSFFDLERAVDRRKLGAPEQTLSQLTGLVVLDEIQRQPHPFEALRVLLDGPACMARFLLMPPLPKTISVLPAQRIPALVRQLIA